METFASSSRPNAEPKRHLTRRGFLGLGAALVGGVLVGCGDNDQRRTVMPEASDSPQASPSVSTETASPNPEKTPQRPEWLKATNPALAEAIRREGEDMGARADAARRIAMVVGVPVSELATESELNIARVTPRKTDANGSVVVYAQLDKDTLPRMVLTDPRTKQRVEAYAVRIEVTEESTIGYVSGGIDEDTGPDPSWAAESTLPGAVAAVDAPEWAHIPLVS